MEQGFLFKDVFNRQLIEGMAGRIKEVWPVFNKEDFVTNASGPLAELELKQRAAHISECLKKNLPARYPEAIKIILNSFDAELQVAELKGFEGFYYMPFSIFVATQGLDHFDLSMNALYEITKRFTSEDAIRSFLVKFPERTLAVLHQWAHDENVHVRRLVSEGTRPRLPWAQRLPAFQDDPGPVLELLELLKQDPELYVRRSVANNLNDIAKDNPDLVIKTLEKWSQVKNPGIQWIIRHASRTLVKQGDPRVLSLLGYNTRLKIEIENFKIEPRQIEFGGKIFISFEVISSEKKAQKIILDYIIHHVKANGKTTPKVFKLSQKVISAGQKVSITKNHSFQAITTRVYYPGEHRVEIQVNGNILASGSFILLEKQTGH